ncbi:MAG: helix-turn-helix domain-containing protein [Gammaproteobacteria bacterium]
MTEVLVTTGPRLKAERERRGLSAQKAADELHLDGWVIDALEAEDYERVGPSVYAKGHLKRYAALLGLPAAEIMAGYESRSQAPRPPPPAPASVRLRTDTPAVSNLPWPQIVGSLVVLLLVLVVLWWKPWHQRGSAPAHSVPVADATGAAARGAATGDIDPAAESTGAVAAAATAATSTSVGASPPSAALTASTLAAPPSAQVVPAAGDATAGAGRAHLRMSFSADSWVDIHDAAGRRAFAGKGRANTVKTVAGSAPMRVYLGFASGVQLEINNRAVAIGPQFVAGDVARFEAGADGVLRRAGTPAAGTPAAQSRNARPTG